MSPSLPAPVKQSELEWLERMRDELRAERSRPHQLMQHARLNAVCAAHRRTGLFSTAECETELVKNDEALREVWGKKGG